MFKFREIASRKADGTFTYTGRTVNATRKALQPNPYMPGTMKVAIKVGPCAWSHMVVDPNW